MAKHTTPRNQVDALEAAPVAAARHDRPVIQSITAAYQLNAIYQLVRSMKRTPEGRAALAAKIEELQARGILKRGM